MTNDPLKKDEEIVMEKLPPDIHFVIGNGFNLRILTSNQFPQEMVGYGTIDGSFSKEASMAILNLGHELNTYKSAVQDIVSKMENAGLGGQWLTYAKSILSNEYCDHRAVLDDDCDDYECSRCGKTLVATGWKAVDND